MTEIPRFDPDRADGVREEDVLEILDRGERGEQLTPCEMSAWTGYELGWKDGWADGAPKPSPWRHRASLAYATLATLALVFIAPAEAAIEGIGSWLVSHVIAITLGACLATLAKATR